MSEQVIYIKPALCKNKGCNRPVFTREVRAFALDRAKVHEGVDPTWCMKCNADYLRKARADRSDGGLISCVPWPYFDEDVY